MCSIFPTAGGIVTTKPNNPATTTEAGRPDGGYRQTLPWRLYNSAAQLIDQQLGWDKLPKPLGLLVLIGLRNILRQKNLQDTNVAPAVNLPPIQPFSSTALTARTDDGSYNDLSARRMGMAGARFGRNIPLESTWPESAEAMMTPNPRVVSRQLMTRSAFQPAPSINVLAGAWIQFMVKDWFSHGQGDPARAYELPLTDDDPWPTPPLLVPATVPDPTRETDNYPPTFANISTAWWDGSSIYGDSAEQQAAIRAGAGGKLKVSPDGVLIMPDNPTIDPTHVPGFWVGLAMMGSLFCLEHNAICDRLAQDNPTWDDEELFQRARLVLAALVAKIHTVEWTPAVISHPTTVAALRANWYGIAGERIHNAFGRISSSEIISGIPGGTTEHFGTPFSLTEEFSIVYRMHPLIPDDYTIRAWQDDAPLVQYNLGELTGPAARDVLNKIDMTNLLYSFGTDNPGAIVLNNFPRFLQQFTRPDGKVIDLAATDILRTRELGVPRYNEFRRLLHLKPARDFADLSDDKDTQNTLREVYGGNIERVDTIVGMFAEKRPEGFAFSDTAFRIFILMASRRLNSDRFFTTGFTPEVYSPAGFRWVAENGMTSVLLRHYPQLRPSLADVDNPFAPWLKGSDPANP
jgi:hypothetical protein